MEEKTALIVTDGGGCVKKMAKAIAASLDGFSVTALSAEEFSGTQLLAAGMFFFGSETPRPPSFAGLDAILRHINLAGRSCGIFSNSEEAAEYLRILVHDSELDLYPDVLTEEKDIPDWTKGLAARIAERKLSID